MTVERDIKEGRFTVVTPKDLKKMQRIARREGIRVDSVRRLHELGVRMRDLEDVLELRECLTFRQGKTLNVMAAPTIEAMASAYQDCDDDIDQLEDLVDIAFDVLKQESNKIGFGRRGSEGRVINNALETAKLSKITGRDVIEGAS